MSYLHISTYSCIVIHPGIFNEDLDVEVSEL